MRIRSFVSTLLLIVLAASCGDSTSPKPSLTGQWEGVAGAGAVFLSLVDNSGAITGTGTLTQPSRAMIVAGTFNGSAFDLTLSMSTGAVRFTGFHHAPQSEPQNLDGTFNGPGFNNASVTLFKPR